MGGLWGEGLRTIEEGAEPLSDFRAERALDFAGVFV